MEIGLYEKEYSPMQSKEYPFYEFDSKHSRYLYYKKIPIDITDEEFAEILKYRKPSSKYKPNVVSGVLCFFGVMFVLGGFVAGIVYGIIRDGYNGSPSGFNFAIAIIYWYAGLFSGFLTIGFSKIIQLLDDIKRKG